jgi:hypothetical protein
MSSAEARPAMLRTKAKQIKKINFLDIIVLLKKETK